MRPLWWTVVRSGGLGRAALVAVCTALTSGLLLVAVSIARLGSSYTDDHLFAPVGDPGTRAGAVFGVVLVTLPFLLLLDQALRLGASDRERRSGALSIAGAAPTDLRRWGAVEVGVPAAVGAVGGLLVHALLRAALSGAHMGEVGMIVPPDGPGWWSVPVVLGVSAYGAAAGRRAAGRASDAWLTSRSLRPAPRPWPGLALLVAAVLAVAGAVGAGTAGGRVTTTGLLLAALSLLVVGTALLAPWLVQRVACRGVRRTDDPARLLGLRRIVADPGPAARAGAATGAVALTGAVLVTLTVELGRPRDGQWDVDRVASFVLIGVLALVSTAVVAGSLVVHAVETLVDRRRSTAALVAGGVPVEVLARSVRTEGLAASLPVAIPAVVLGGPVFSFFVTTGTLESLLYVVVGSALVVAVVAGVVSLAARLVRPWVEAAASTAHLRTA